MRKMFAAVLLAAAMALSGCGTRVIPPASTGTPAPVTPEATMPQPELTPTPEPTETPDPAVEALAGLTTEQKVGQLLVAGIEGAVPGTDAVQAIEQYQVGGIILFGRNVECAEQLTALNNGLKALNQDHIPLFLCVDEEGGMVSRMPGELMDLPNAWTYGQIEDAEERLNACFTLGQTLAAECAAFGFNLDFAPVMDIWSNPENTVIGKRAFGTDLSASAAANQTACGMMAGDVIPAAKHFPGHGDTAVDSHYALPVVEKTLEELEQLELVPFHQAIENTCVFGTWNSERGNGIPVIMAGHILMTQIDPEYPVSLSHRVVTGLLREKMGFTGVVCTDDLTMAAISDTYGMGEAAVLAVEAGCDLLLVCHGTDELTRARDALLEAVVGGRISEARLDESVLRILTLKLQYQLTNDPVETPDIAALNRQISACLPE